MLYLSVRAVIVKQHIDKTGLQLIGQRCTGYAD